MSTRLCRSSFAYRFCMCVRTVFRLTPRPEAISSRVAPCVSICRTVRSRGVRLRSLLSPSGAANVTAELVGASVASASNTVSASASGSTTRASATSTVPRTTSPTCGDRRRTCLVSATAGSRGSSPMMRRRSASLLVVMPRAWSPSAAMPTDRQASLRSSHATVTSAKSRSAHATTTPRRSLIRVLGAAPRSAGRGRYPGRRRE